MEFGVSAYTNHVRCGGLSDVVRWTSIVDCKLGIVEVNNVIVVRCGAGLFMHIT